MIPEIDKNHPQQTQWSHWAMLQQLWGSYAKLRRNYAKLRCNYAKLRRHCCTKIRRNYATSHYLIDLTGEFRKNVAVQTCKLIPEQQQELQLSVGLVRNITSLFQLHWDKWVKVPDQDVVKPWKMLKPRAPASCTVFV